MRFMSWSVVAVVVFGAWGVVWADIAACNKEAQEAIRTDSASPKAVSPNTKDVGRAAEARRSGAAADRADSTTRSDDPQLEGIDAEGAKDPLYQAAYRTCMRKSGF
jgi:hypothetical protein